MFLPHIKAGLKMWSGASHPITELLVTFWRMPCLAGVSRNHLLRSHSGLCSHVAAPAHPQVKGLCFPGENRFDFKGRFRLPSVSQNFRSLFTKRVPSTHYLVGIVLSAGEMVGHEATSFLPLGSFHLRGKCEAKRGK